MFEHYIPDLYEKSIDMIALEIEQEIQAVKKTTVSKTKRTKEYLNNKDLYDEIVKSKDLDRLTPTAEKMLILLAERAITKMKYVNSDDKNDCLSFAILDLLKYWRSFNPKYKNAFAYFTEIAKKGYAKGWNKLYPKKYDGTVSIDGSADSEGIYSI
jgi:hypothetical protein